MDARKIKRRKYPPPKRRVYKSRYAKGRNKGRLVNIIVNACALILILALAVFIYNSVTERRVNLPQNSEYIAALRISYSDFSILSRVSDERGLDFPEVLAYYFVENDFFRGVPRVNSEEYLNREFLDNLGSVRAAYRRSDIEPLEDMFRTLLTEITYFPIPNTFEGREVDDFTYSDTFGALRSYGGDRPHLGTDIVDMRNIRGRIPIVSMTEGRILHMGWNELGGFRIGIISESGTYYYYAHLASFAYGIDVGDTVSAGDLLGFMGDTGYSPIVGTTGNFVVHLHVGIAYNAPFTDEMLWINPYILLRNIERSRISF